MKIEWLPEAERNRETQMAYIAEHNVRAAIKMGDAIEKAIDRLSSYPESAPRGRVAGTRELTVVGTPFLVIYRIEQQAVLILRLLHGAQRWPVLPED